MIGGFSKLLKLEVILSSGHDDLIPWCIGQPDGVSLDRA